MAGITRKIRVRRTLSVTSVSLGLVLWVSGASVSGDDTPEGPASSAVIRLQPADVSYLGAFRLPGDGERPETFAYGGNAMTFDPGGDSAGSDDGFPGSLFITGHERMPYGERHKDCSRVSTRSRGSGCSISMTPPPDPGFTWPGASTSRSLTTSRTPC